MLSEPRRAWAVAALLLAGVQPAESRAGVVIESVLAAVDEQPVLQSETQAVARLRGLKLADALEALIDERLMQREAARLREAAVTPSEEERALASLVAPLPQEVRDAIGEKELRRIARRQTAVLKYVEFRFRPQIRIEAESIARAYDQEYAGKAGAPALEAVAGEIESRLVRRALDLRLEAWIAELRAGARIRYNPR